MVISCNQQEIGSLYIYNIYIYIVHSAAADLAPPFFHWAHLQSMMAMLVHHMRHAAKSQRGNSDAWSKAWAAAKASVLLVQDVHKGMSSQDSTDLPKPPKASCNHFRQHVGV